MHGQEPFTGRELLLVVLVVVVFMCLGLVAIADGSPLGHDESVYALRAEYVATGAEHGLYWADYRAPGLPFLLAPMWAVRFTEPYLRLVVLGFGVAGVVASWLVARRLFGPIIGLLTAALLALSPGWLDSSVAVWPDVPGAALGLWAVAIFATSIDAERIRTWALTAAPIAVAATVIRYGAPIPIGLALSILGLWAWRQVRRSPVVVGTVALATAVGCGIVLLVPSVTGAETPPLVSINKLQQASAYPFGRTFLDFGRQLPGVLGPVVGLSVVIGWLLALRAVLRGAVSQRALGAVFAATVLIGLGLAFSLRHGEPRYLMPVVPFLLMGAAAGLGSMAEVLKGAITASIGLLAAAAATAASLNVALASNEVRSEWFSVIKQAARELGANATRPCVVITSYSPQVAWYSDCAVTTFPAGEGEIGRQLPRQPSTGELMARVDEFPPPTTVYMLIAKGGKRQPTGPVLEASVDSAQERVLTVGDPEAANLRHVEVYLMRAPARPS
ncbi:MAG: glycosyltransferase family 39 protein [Actinomycetota bacterium]|nr:glycosyltransferase family 39 protein [Actinomycetota bacterium]